jgi:FixJ family two-component response regulator
MTIGPQTATIYVVDDDPAVRQSLAELVQSPGFVCKTFASAEEFLAHHHHEEGVGCVVTDYCMPGMNGTELQTALAKRNSKLPVIVVSGFADVPVAVRAMQHGAITLLQKPFNRNELLAAVETALQVAARRAGEAAAESEIAAQLARLTAEETAVMELLLAGHPNKAIARELDLGLRTVERRRQQVLEKMGVGSLPELACLIAPLRKSPARQAGCPI